MDAKAIRPFTREDLDRHEIQLEDYPDALPKYETLHRYIAQIRQLLDENERLQVYVDKTNADSERIAIGATRLEIEIQHLQADKAVAVETLKFYANKPCIQSEDIGWNTGYIARRALERIESGEKNARD